MSKRFVFTILLIAASFVAGAASRPGERALRFGAPAAEPAGRPPDPRVDQPRPVSRALPPGGLPDLAAVAERTTPAVVNISSIDTRRRSPFADDPFFRYFFGDDEPLFGYQRRPSLGSGVAVSSDGYILTNAHVVGDTQNRVTVALSDKQELQAEIVGLDSGTDIALLKVEASGLPTIPWGDSASLKVAEWVLAIGNPYQLRQSVSLGIVSAVGRTNLGITAIEDFIQTDAAINPGNSGGALINSRGELVGINTAIFSQAGGYQGIGFAVPSNLAQKVMKDLIRYGEVRRGWIGLVEIGAITTRVARELGVPDAQGVIVHSLLRGSPAHAAGLEPGDVIVSYNGRPVEDPSQLVRFIADSAIGSTVRVEVLRGGRRRELRIQVGQEPQRTRRAV